MPTKNLEQHAQHQAAYRERLKTGHKPIANPWSWITLADVQKIALDAYKVASYEVNELGWSHDRAREYFADELTARFGTFVAVKAVEAGMPCTVVPGIGPNDKAVIRGAARALNKVAGWRPQYPVYKQVAPAKRSSAPGAVINADEGNVDDQDSKR